MRLLRPVFALLLLALTTVQVCAADLWRPKGSPGFTDSNGKPLTAGKLCYYDAQTSDPRTVYKDAGSLEAWAQPIELDAAGKLSDPIYVGTGAFKEVLRSKDAEDCDTGSTIFTSDDIPGAIDLDSIAVDFAKPKMPVLAQAGTVTLGTDALGKLINVDASGGATITLPSVTVAGDGGVIAIRKSDSGGTAVTINASGSELINGESSYPLQRFSESVTLVSDGAGWSVVEPLVSGSVSFSRLASSAYDNDSALAANSATRLPTQQAVKTYVDGAVASGIKWKDPVIAATTSSGTLASDFENGDTVDGVELSTSDRLLIKNQSDASENGIYVVAASGAPTRSSDADQDAELPGATVFVEEGTSNAATQWTVTNESVTIGSTNIIWAKISASLQFTADDATLELDGLEFSIKDGGVGSDQIASGVVTSGKLATAVSNRLMAVGTVFDHVGSTCPAYSVESYGQTLSRSTYSTLFAVCAACGAGDGSTTFTTPDLRGRVVAGEDDMGGTSANRLTGITNSLNGDTLGATGGVEGAAVAKTNLSNESINFSLQTQTHSHNDTFVLANATGVVRNFNEDKSPREIGNAGIVGNNTVSDVSWTSSSLGISGGVSAAGALSISGSITLGGSNTPLSNVQPTAILKKCIHTGV